MKKKTRNIIVVLLILVILSGTLVFVLCRNDRELLTIKSEEQLLKFYEGDREEQNEIALNLLGMPFSVLVNAARNRTVYKGGYDLVYETNSLSDTSSIIRNIGTPTTAGSAGESTKVSTKDYSTTNIQVENVDEADITKTDGDYIYSISENKVIITDVKDPTNVKIAAQIEANDNNAPDDLMLYNDKLVVISAKMTSSSSYRGNNNTLVEIYDITDRTSPRLLKDYELKEPYYTSRCIDGQLFVISTGNMRKENGKIDRTYVENSATKEIKLDEIKYLKDVNTSKQTIIATLNLNDVKQDVDVSSILVDISNAYVSENSIYLLNKKYKYESYVPPVSSIFGPAGIFGAFETDFNYYSSGYKTDIYKFDILKNGDLLYKAKTTTEGETINQYSLDEKNGHLRVALHDNDGSRIVIFDENMKEIGRTDNLAKGEKMYSSRFMGDRAYLVTYKTVDPLFVIDLSNESNPKVLGKLKIPGYSTYLHPYDENHLIGIGMETVETVNRDSTGKVRSTTARITGMKMALFDVTNVESPKEISKVVIGDSRTTSAILTNPKALLFSKEKELIAIPVNNYKEDFEIDANSDDYESTVKAYTSYGKEYVAEGYFVYNINLEEGIKLKGVINHEKVKKNGYYSYYNNTKLLRGLYIDENLYTVSESAIKVNRLDTLEQINELKIR